MKMEYIGKLILMWQAVNTDDYHIKFFWLKVNQDILTVSLESLVVQLMYKSFKTDGTPVMNEVLFNLPLKRKYLSRIKEQRDGMLKQFIRLDDFQQEIINSSAMRDVFLSCHKPLALAPLRMRIMLILHAEEGRNSSIRLTEQCKLASSWPVWTLFQCS